MQPLTTYVGVVHPWLCDTMGHLNVRHYMGMFDDASFHMLGHLTGVEKDKNVGWADVRYEIDFKHETQAGTLITVRSHVVRIGRSSVSYAHVLAGTLEGEVHAEAKVTSVRFDLVARKGIEIDAETRARAEALLAG